MTITTNDLQNGFRLMAAVAGEIHAAGAQGIPCGLVMVSAGLTLTAYDALERTLCRSLPIERRGSVLYWTEAPGAACVYCGSTRASVADDAARLEIAQPICCEIEGAPLGWTAAQC